VVVEAGFGPEFYWMARKRERQVEEIAVAHGYAVVRRQRGRPSDLRDRLTWSSDESPHSRFVVLELARIGSTREPGGASMPDHVHEYRRLLSYGAGRTRCQCRRRELFRSDPNDKPQG
jgi:hypothetical protein